MGGATEPSGAAGRDRGRRAPRRGRAVLISLGVALGLVAVAAAGVFAVLHGWQRERVRDALVAVVARRLDAEVTLDALDGPLHRRVALRGLTIRRAGETPFEVDEVELWWDLSGFFERRVVVESIHVRRPRLEVTRAADGAVRVASLRPAGEGGSAQGGDGAAPLGLSVLVREARVQDARVDFTGRDADPGGVPDMLRGVLDLRLGAWRWPAGAGDPWPQEAEAALEIRTARLRRRRVHAGRVAVRVEGRRVELLPSHLEGPAGRVELEGEGALRRPRGRLAFERASGRARFAGVDPAVLLEDAQLGDRIAGEARLELAPPGPAELRLEVSLRSERLGGLGLESAVLAGAITPASGAWRIEDGALRGDLGRVDVSGRGDLEEIAALRVAASGVDLARVPGPLARSFAVGGRLDLEARLAGPWRDPTGRIELAAAGLTRHGVELGDLELRADALGGRRLRVEALAIETPAAGAGPGRVRLAEPALVRIEPDTLRVEDATLSWQGGALRIAGGIAAERFRELRLELRALDAGAAGAWLGAGLAGRAGEAPELGGTVSSTLALDGPLARPSVAGTVTWDAPVLGPAIGDRIALELDGDAESLRADGTLVKEGAQALRLSAVVPWDALARGTRGVLVHPAARASLRAEAFDLAWLRELNPALEDVSGSLDGALELQGDASRARLPALQAELLLARPALGRVTADRVDLTLESVGPALRADGRVAVGGADVAWIEASLPYAELAGEPRAVLEHADTQATLRADALDLAWLAPFTPRQLAGVAGRLSADFRLRGGAPQPSLRGELRVADGAFALPALGTAFSQVAGRADVDGTRVAIEGLRIRGGEGVAELAGRFDAGGDPAEPLELRLTMRDFEAARTRSLHADLDGELRVDGTTGRPRIEGEIALRKARAFLSEADDPLRKEIRVLGLPEADGDGSIRERPRAAPGWLDAAALDLRARVPRNSWVRGRGADLEVEGVVRARKAPGEPTRYTGRLAAVRGLYRFQGRRFEIERGVATLSGQSEIDPTLDVVAVHRVRDVTLRVRISGPVSEPRLVLESDPPLDETEMLAYLAFGRPTHELTAGESLELEAAATQLVGQLLLGELGASLGSGLPVDSIDVGAGGDGQPAAVEVGKYLGRNLFVRVRRAFGSGDEDRVRIEWRVRPGVSIESEMTRSGSSGADLIWSTDY